MGPPGRPGTLGHLSKQSSQALEPPAKAQPRKKAGASPARALPRPLLWQEGGSPGPAVWKQPSTVCWAWAGTGPTDSSAAATKGGLGRCHSHTGSPGMGENHVGKQGRTISRIFNPQEKDAGVPGRAWAEPRQRPQGQAPLGKRSKSSRQNRSEVLTGAPEFSWRQCIEEGCRPSLASDAMTSSQ